MNNTGIILVSHGEFAKAALASAEMIAGKQQDVVALGLEEDMSLETMEEAIEEAYMKLEKRCSDVIILCDIYGGTPFNAISRNVLRGMRTIAYSGLSLPLLIDLLLCRNLQHEEISARIEQTHHLSLQPICVALQDLDENEEITL